MTCRLSIRKANGKTSHLTIVKSSKNRESYESKERLEELNLWAMTDEIKDLLRDWAEWTISVNGYPKSTTIWRLANSPGEDPFQSRIPSGVIPPARLQKLQKAFNKLLNTKVGEDIAVTRMFYLAGLEATQKEFRCSRRTVYERKRCGEAAIQGFLRA